MQPNVASDALFNVFSTLSGGFVTDLSTAMMAIVVIMILIMGLDMLKIVFLNPYIDKFNMELEYRDYKKKMDKAHSFKERYAKEKHR